MYYDGGGQVQKKTCNFCIKVRKIGQKDWQSVELEYDFSKYGSDTNQNQTHQERFDFKQTKKNGDFRDAFAML